MWPLLVPLVLQWTLITALPLAEDVRETREVNPGDCCPCPVIEEGIALPLPADDSVAEASTSLQAVLPAPVSGAGGCLCMLRDADSSADSSHSLPRQVPLWNTLTLAEQDPKPLLHPEVDLASSVLETIREATDEEYKEALAREQAAARSIAGSSEEDLKTSPASIVTIILNPAELDDDILAQGTHAHESRCIHGPLGSARVATIKTRPLPHLIRELLGMPVDTVRRNNLKMLDSGVEASNVHEQLVDSSNVQGVKVKPETEFKSAQGPTTPKLPSLIDNVIDFTKKAKSNFEEAVKKVPKFNLPTMIKVDEGNQESSNKQEARGHIPDGNIDQNTPKSPINSINEDNCNAPSNGQKSIIPDDARDISDSIKIINPSLNSNDELDTHKPLFSNNLITFRNGDSLSKSILDNIGEKEIKIKVPYLKVKPLFETEKVSESDANLNSWKLPNIRDLFMDRSKSISNPDDATETNFEPDTAVETNSFRTEIIDAFPSASVNKMIQSDAARSENTLKKHTSCEISSDNVEDLSRGPVDRGIIESLPDSTLIKPEIKEAEEVESLVDSNRSIDSSESINQQQKTTADVNSINTSDDLTGMAEFNNFENNENPSVLNISGTEIPQKSTVVLQNIKEKVLRKLDELNKISLNKVSNQQFDIPEENITDSDTITSFEIKDFVDDPDIGLNPVTLKELQDMSDSLLDESQNREAIVDPNCTDDNSMSNIQISLPVQEQEVSEKLKSSEEDVFESSTISNETEAILSDNNKNDLKEATSNDVIETTCDAHSLQSKDSSSAVGSEMLAESSDLIPKLLGVPSLLDNTNRLLGSRLMQSPIVQPSALPDITNIFPLDIGDVLRSNPGLPSLDEIRSRISGFLEMNERDDSGMDMDDDSNVNKPIISQPQVPKTSLSLIRPMEEVDFDLFQLKPLTSSRTLKQNIPNKGLNLNSFKARLQVPAEAIEPLKLQSMKSFKGKNGNILGAKLSVAPKVQKFDNLGKLNLHDFSGRKDNLQSLSVLTSLEKIKHSLVPNNLLGSPHSLLSEFQPIGNFRSAQPLTQLDTLREKMHSDTLSALQNLQQSVASSLNDAKLRHESILANTMPLQQTDLLDNLERARLDLSDKLLSMQSDSMGKSKLPLLNTDKFSNDFPSLIQLPTSGTTKSKQPKLVSSSKKISNTRKKPKPSNMQQRISSNLINDKTVGNQNSFKNNQILKSNFERVNTKTPPGKKNTTVKTTTKSTVTENISGTKVPNLNVKNLKTVKINQKDSNLAATDHKPSRLGLSPLNRLTKDRLASSTPTDVSLRDDTKANGVRKLKPSLTKSEVNISKLNLTTTKKSNSESLSNQMRSSLNERLSNSDNTGLTSMINNAKTANSVNKKESLEKLKDSLNTRLFSSLKPIKDLVEGATENQDTLLGLPKLSIENLKKPQEVVDDLLNSARETLSNVNLPMNKPDDNFFKLKSPSEISEKLRSSLDNIHNVAPFDVLTKSKGVEIASPDEVLTSIKERFSEIDMTPLKLQGLPERRLSDMVQGASQRLQSMTPSINLLDTLRATDSKIDIQSPAEVLSNLRNSARDALSEIQLPNFNLPTLKSVEELPKRDLLDNLKVSVVDLPSPVEVIDNVRNSAREALTEIKTSNLNLPQLTSVAECPKLDLLDNLKEPIVDLPAPSEIISNLRDSVRDSLSDLNIKPLPNLSKLNLNEDSLVGASENLKTLIVSPANLDPVINKLRSSINDKLSDIKLKPLLKTAALSDFNLNDKPKEALEENSQISDASDTMKPKAMVTKLRNSINDRINNRNKDILESPSESVGAIIPAPRKALKNKVSYRCRMVCEEIDDE